MKERDFYKRMLERSSMPDFSEIENTILNEPPAEKNHMPDKKIKVRTGAAALGVCAAVTLILTGIFQFCGINDFNSSELPEKYIPVNDFTTEAEETTAEENISYEYHSELIAAEKTANAENIGKLHQLMLKADIAAEAVFYIEDDSGSNDYEGYSCYWFSELYTWSCRDTDEANFSEPSGYICENDMWKTYLPQNTDMHTGARYLIFTDANNHPADNDWIFIVYNGTAYSMNDRSFCFTMSDFYYSPYYDYYNGKGSKAVQRDRTAYDKAMDGAVRILENKMLPQSLGSENPIENFTLSEPVDINGRDNEKLFLVLINDIVYCSFSVDISDDDVCTITDIDNEVIYNRTKQYVSAEFSDNVYTVNFSSDEGERILNMGDIVSFENPAAGEVYDRNPRIYTRISSDKLTGNLETNLPELSERIINVSEKIKEKYSPSDAVFDKTDTTYIDISLCRDIISNIYIPYIDIPDIEDNYIYADGELYYTYDGEAKELADYIKLYLMLEDSWNDDIDFRNRDYIMCNVNVFSEDSSPRTYELDDKKFINNVMDIVSDIPDTYTEPVPDEYKNIDSGDTDILSNEYITIKMYDIYGKELYILIDDINKNSILLNHKRYYTYYNETQSLVYLCSYLYDGSEKTARQYGELF